METVRVGNEDVILDDANLIVSEVGLNDFLCKFAGIYNYYTGKWAEAQFLNYLMDDQYDALQNKKFDFYKNEGSTDKLADARSKSNEEVLTARMASRKSRYVMQKLHGYLRSLDKAHEDALNLGYNVRKELDKVFPKEIKHSDVDKKLEAMFSEEE